MPDVHRPWPRSPEELVRRFEMATDPLLERPGVERRKMFGYPACFLDGNMFTGLHEDRWIVRLADADRQELARLGGAQFAPMPGRPMKEYLALPADQREPQAVERWLAAAIGHAATLPPKDRARSRR
jgi:TfoX/Sxy family transcriptional regulator of competence genes